MGGRQTLVDGLRPEVVKDVRLPIAASFPLRTTKFEYRLMV